MRPGRLEFISLLLDEAQHRLLDGEGQDVGIAFANGTFELIEICGYEDTDSGVWPVPWLSGITMCLRAVAFREVDLDTGEASDPFIVEPWRSQIYQLAAEEWRAWSRSAATLEKLRQIA